MQAFGDIIFEVSENKTMTYNEFQRNTEPRWIEHKVLHDKPELEFEGPGSDDISLRILLRAELGINPEKQMAKIREFARKGKKALFIRGNKPISSNFWVIKRAVEVHKVIDNKGNILTMEVDLNLLEYPREKKEEPKKKTTSSIKMASTSSKTSKLGTITITVKSVHIRSGPGVNNKVLGIAKKNDKLKVVGKKNGWYALGGGKYISASSAYSNFKGA